MLQRSFLYLTIFSLGMWSSSSCSTTAVDNIPAAQTDFVGPFGRPTPRAISVGFINDTPFRAIFTFGAYDQLDENTLPTGFGQLRLEGNTSSAVQTQPCRKTFSVGGAELIKLIEDNESDPNITVTDENALIDGVYFSGAPVGDPLEAEPTEGTAEGRAVLNGVDFTCQRVNIDDLTGTGLLLFNFVQDAGAPGGFRIDFSFVQP
jgi:hypothetical protein